MELLFELEEKDSEFLGKLIKKAPMDDFGIDGLEFKREERTIRVFGTDREIAFFIDIIPYELGEFEQFKIIKSDLKLIIPKKEERIRIYKREKKLIVEVGNRIFNISEYESENKLKAKINDFGEPKLSIDARALKEIVGEIRIHLDDGITVIEDEKSKIEVVGGVIDPKKEIIIEKRIVEKFRPLLTLFKKGEVYIYLLEEKGVFALQIIGEQKRLLERSVYFVGPMRVEEKKERKSELILKSYNERFGEVLKLINPNIWDSIIIHFNNDIGLIEISQLDDSSQFIFNAQIEESKIIEEFTIKILGEEINKLSKIRTFGGYRVLKDEKGIKIEFETDKGIITLYGQQIDEPFRFKKLPDLPNWIKLPAVIFEDAIKNAEGFSDGEIILRMVNEPRRLIISSVNDELQYIGELRIDDDPIYGIVVEEPTISSFDYRKLLELLKSVKRAKEEIGVYLGQDTPIIIEVERLGADIKMALAPLWREEERVEEIEEEERVEEIEEEERVEEERVEEIEEEERVEEEIEEEERVSLEKYMELVRSYSELLEERNKLIEENERLKKKVEELSKKQSEAPREIREIREEIREIREEIREQIREIRDMIVRESRDKEVIERIKRDKEEIVRMIQEVRERRNKKRSLAKTFIGTMIGALSFCLTIFSKLLKVL